MCARYVHVPTGHVPYCPQPLPTPGPCIIPDPRIVPGPRIIPCLRRRRRRRRRRRLGHVPCCGVACMLPSGVVETTGGSGGRWHAAGDGAASDAAMQRCSAQPSHINPDPRLNPLSKSQSRWAGVPAFLRCRLGRGLSTPSSLRGRSVDCPRRSIPCAISAWEVFLGPRLMSSLGPAAERDTTRDVMGRP